MTKGHSSKTAADFEERQDPYLSTRARVLRDVDDPVWKEMVRHGTGGHYQGHGCLVDLGRLSGAAGAKDEPSVPGAAEARPAVG